MTGPYDSVIGIDKELVLRKFRTGLPVRYATARRDPRLCGVILDVDPSTGRATAIERLQLRNGFSPPAQPPHEKPL
jgi:hypothetical protein